MNWGIHQGTVYGLLSTHVFKQENCSNLEMVMIKVLPQCKQTHITRVSFVVQEHNKDILTLHEEVN